MTEAIKSIEADLRLVITACVKAYISSGGNWKRLSVMTGISSGSLRKLVDNETVHPRFHTIEAVLNGFGRELALLNVSPERGKEKRNERNRVGNAKRSATDDGANHRQPSH